RATWELSRDHTKDDQDKAEAGLLGIRLVEPAGEPDERLEDRDTEGEEDKADQEADEGAHRRLPGGPGAALLGGHHGIDDGIEPEHKPQEARPRAVRVDRAGSVRPGHG